MHKPRGDVEISPLFYVLLLSLTIQRKLSNLKMAAMSIANKHHRLSIYMVCLKSKCTDFPIYELVV